MEERTKEQLRELVEATDFILLHAEEMKQASKRILAGKEVYQNLYILTEAETRLQYWTNVVVQYTLAGVVQSLKNQRTLEESLHVEAMRAVHTQVQDPDRLQPGDPNYDPDVGTFETVYNRLYTNAYNAALEKRGIAK